MEKTADEKTNEEETGKAPRQPFVRVMVYEVAPAARFLQAEATHRRAHHARSRSIPAGSF